MTIDRRKAGTRLRAGRGLAAKRRTGPFHSGPTPERSASGR